MKPAGTLIVKRSTRSLLAACLVLSLAGGALAQAQPPAQEDAAAQAVDGQAAGADVPLRRVTLYSSGVGFFEHAGEVPEGGRLELRFREDQVNDILKSLEVFGADSATVSFDTSEPLSERLGKFGIDVSGDTSLPAILVQLRGEVVTLRAPEAIQGRILDVTEQASVVIQGDGGVTVPDHVITLVTDAGLRQVQLRQVQQIELANAQLSEELNKALMTLAGARNQDARAVDIRLGGEMDDAMSLRYLVEAPVWKTSYRLALDEDGDASLQGWAVVENTTDSDWDAVVLTLASGRPVSFVQDLYTPLRLERPVVVPELFASLLPQQYELGRAGETPEFADRGVARGGRRAQMDLAEAESRAPGAPPAPDAGLAFGGGAAANLRHVAAAAMAGSRGELFQFTVEQGVDLPRGRSAMLPILTQEVDVERLSVYDESTHATHPMRGVRLINGDDLKLPAGPMTVLDDGAYAGDAQLPFTGPEDKRLLTYAVDLEMQVTPSQAQQTRLVRGVIAQGVLRLTYTADLTRTYAVVNESGDDRTLLIAHPINHGWELSDPEEAKETTSSHYRFEVEAQAGQEAELGVTETRTYGQQYRLVDMDTNQLAVWADHGELDEDLRDALATAAGLRNQEQQLRQQANDRRSQTQAITREQGRIRSNMSSVDRNSQLYQRYVTKLSEQEDLLEQLQTEAFELDEQANAKRDELSAYLSGLDVE